MATASSTSAATSTATQAVEEQKSSRTFSLTSLYSGPRRFSTRTKSSPSVPTKSTISSNNKAASPPAKHAEASKQRQNPKSAPYDATIPLPPIAPVSGPTVPASASSPAGHNAHAASMESMQKGPLPPERSSSSHRPARAAARPETDSPGSEPLITISTFLRSTDPMNDTAYRAGLASVEHSSTHVREVKSASTFSSVPRSSRSPSPSSKDESDSTPRSSLSSSSLPSLTSPTSKTATPERRGILRTSTGFGAKSRRPLSMMFVKNSASDTNIPPHKPPPLPSTDFLVANGSTPQFSKKAKDDLWDPYRTLEHDFQKFQSKSTIQRAGIIRQSVLPFLRKYKDSASSSVAPDELERRVRTLHKWWTGLLAQLRSRTHQAVSGTDRPLYFEAIAFLMSRPEWRAPPSSFAPLSLRTPTTATSASSSSLSSSVSSYSLQKSVTHNIEVLYSRTLSDTLAFVIEKMNLRSAPPTMVAFSGKVIAFAFFFCPGVAEMLISLWGLSPAVLRRVMPGFGIGRGHDMKGVAENIASEFPETLSTLAFTSLATTIRRLKQPAKPPIGTQIDWTGTSWTNRWRGRDSDLFFVFLRYYHILACEYVPEDLSVPARLCVPAYLPVMAQVLTALENTIQRKTNQPDSSTSASTTFEDLLNATATLPITTRNAARSMGDNKLLVLLKYILTDSACSDTCRSMYVSSFIAMLKTSVQKTKLYDGDACFQVCDLLEEVLPILCEASRQQNEQLVDWPFWLNVAMTMLQSENNMTELRLLSLLYTVWPFIAEDETRKREICLDWLLTEKIWERFFCHWCPMVRAYYMRLVCWRIGRYDGEGTEVDVEIFKTLFIRLRISFAHHLRLKETFERGNGPQPSTAPCLPAPSRRLVILRNDSVTQSQGVILDGIVPTSSMALPSPGILRSNTGSSLATLEETISINSMDSSGSDESVSSTSRRWSSIRSVFSFSRSSSTEALDKITTPPVSERSSPTPEEIPSPPIQPVSTANFKFSLEWLDRPLFGSRERILSPSRLPQPAQHFLANSVSQLPTVDVDSRVRYGKHWTYVGRALSEWFLVIVEHESFLERRKQEGRATDADVESPTLAVDSLRKF